MNPKSSNQRSPLSTNKGPIDTLYRHIELDVIFGSERDIAFSIRLAQHRYRSQRPCVVQINSANYKWQQAPIFNRCADIIVVSDQTLIEPNKIYFINTSHILDKKNGAYWVIKGNSSTPSLCEKLHRLLHENNLFIGDLIILKNAQLKHLLVDLPNNVEQVWYEGDLNSISELNSRAEIASRGEIAKRLCHGIKRHISSKDETKEFDEQSAVAIEEKLLEYLHQYSQIDYQYFRQSWLAEHVQRRCSSLGLQSIKSYINYCESHPDEWQQFEWLAFPCQTHSKYFNEAFSQFKRFYENGYLQDLASNFPGLRFWVPDSGMGEIAYALSLAWQELSTNIPIKIFATDLNNLRIESSSKGLAIDDLNSSPEIELLKEYHGEQKGSFQTLPFLRKQITFSCHDLLNSPGFNHLHLIHAHKALYCYKEPAQRQILSTFNHCLVEGGILWICDYDFNNCEQLGFAPIPGTAGLYKKVSQSRLQIDTSNSQNLKYFKHKYYAPALPSLLSHHKRRNRYSEYHSALDLLIDKHLPSGLLIDKNGNLVHVFGNVSEYVEPFHEGNFSNGITQLLNRKLSSKLTPHINKLLKHSRETQVTLPWGMDEKPSQLVVTLNYLQATESETAYAAVFFEQEIPPSFSRSENDSFALESHLRYIEKLETDLSLLRENEAEDNSTLRQEIEDLHTVISEMALANEQMSIINEKLIKNYDTAMYSYEQCRMALANENKQPDKSQQPAIAIIDSHFKLQYFNDAMSLYLVESKAEQGVDFHVFAKQIGGSELVVRLENCIKNQSASTSKLQAMSTVQLIPLPNNEVLIKLTQIHYPKNLLGPKLPTRLEA